MIFVPRDNLNNLDTNQEPEAKPNEACPARELDPRIKSLTEGIGKFVIGTTNAQSSDDPRVKLRSWLGRVFKIVINDGRVIVGRFVCTDRDGNVILENSYEYAQIDGKTTTNLWPPPMPPTNH